MAIVAYPLLSLCSLSFCLCLFLDRPLRIVLLLTSCLTDCNALAVLTALVCLFAVPTTNKEEAALKRALCIVKL